MQYWFVISQNESTLYVKRQGNENFNYFSLCKWFDFSFYHDAWIEERNDGRVWDDQYCINELLYWCGGILVTCRYKMLSREVFLRYT